MSKYTTEVRFICENYAGLDESAGYNSVDEIIEKSWKKIFDFYFPIYDENYRQVLCSKILRHYYTREIGEETVGLWKLRLHAKMNEIMPYYNKLYTAWAKEFNPLFDTELTREHTLDRTGNQTGETETNTVNRNLYSDTPQGSLQNVDNETYLTNASKDIADGNSNYTQDIKSTDEYLETVKGKSSGVSYSRMLNEYREALLNIDLMVINELNNLFMMIW